MFGRTKKSGLVIVQGHEWMIRACVEIYGYHMYEQSFFYLREL